MLLKCLLALILRGALGVFMGSLQVIGSGALIGLFLALFVGAFVAVDYLPKFLDTNKVQTTTTWNTPTAKSFSITQPKTSPNAIVTAEDLK